MTEAADETEMPLPSDAQTFFLGGLFALGVFAVLYLASAIILPVILAFVLNLLLQPAVRLLGRVHLPRAVGALLTVLLVIGALVGLVAALSVPAATWAERLFESGRPVLIVPFIQKDRLKLDHVMVCWDGSRAATRAIADAMPFLTRSGKTSIVVADTQSAKSADLPGSDIATHLSRHGVNAAIERIPVSKIDVSNAILSYAADTGADCHGRVRAFPAAGIYSWRNDTWYACLDDQTDIDVALIGCRCETNHGLVLRRGSRRAHSTRADRLAPLPK
ncbi:hypothetical protein ACH79_25430 [Bradyrhizobium sp. CCBAU 051011]|nr:hypothetical protein ACH79_25430 [Bradyrhizobium sp. CCBAU 051011]